MVNSRPNIDAAQLRAEIEADRTWREEELRFFENQGSLLKESEQEQYRRALVIILYAHLEGFCKAALASYATHINQAGYLVRDTEWAIAAASLATVFSRLRDNDRKSDIFRRTLPDDSKLHRFCRERDFLEQLCDFEYQAVALDVAEIVDMESNVKPQVLRKVLYRLGLDTELADQWAPDIDKLLAFRNNIAHGTMRTGIEAKQYQRLRDAANAVCDGITLQVFQAARDGRHLRAS